VPALEPAIQLEAIGAALQQGASYVLNRPVRMKSPARDEVMEREILKDRL
jgi:hypothetical protein